MKVSGLLSVRIPLCIEIHEFLLLSENEGNIK